MKIAILRVRHGGATRRPVWLGYRVAEHAGLYRLRLDSRALRRRLMPGPLPDQRHPGVSKRQLGDGDHAGPDDAALIWAGVCQVGSGDRGPAWQVVWCRLWFGARVAAGARGHFRLICEGWLPQDGLCDAPGPRSRIERAGRGLVLIARIAGPGWHASAATPTSNGLCGCGQSGWRAISQTKQASSRATATATVVRSWRGAASRCAQRRCRRAARARRRRSRPVAGRLAAAQVSDTRGGRR